MTTVFGYDHHLSVFISSIPRGSMYGIFTYIYHINLPNVGKYTIHGSSGIEISAISQPKKHKNKNRFGGVENLTSLNPLGTGSQAFLMGILTALWPEVEDEIFFMWPFRQGLSEMFKLDHVSLKFCKTIVWWVKMIQFHKSTSFSNLLLKTGPAAMN